MSEPVAPRPVEHISGDCEVIRKRSFKSDVQVSGTVRLDQCVVDGDLTATDDNPFFVACFVEGKLTHPDMRKVVACYAHGGIVQR